MLARCSEAGFKVRTLPPLGSPILPRATRLARFPCSSGVGSRSSSSPLAMSIMSLASWAGSREAFWPVHRSLVRWPLGQFVGPPCSCLVPAFNAQVADFTICTVRVLEWAVIGRHSVDGPATGTGIFTCIAGSHARFHSRFRGRFGEFRGHKGRISPFGPPRKSFRSLPYSKGRHDQRSTGQVNWRLGSQTKAARARRHEVSRLNFKVAGSGQAMRRTTKPKLRPG
jgi:hypothetical protein